MGHNQNKPGREKRKPKKAKLLNSKALRGDDTLQHIAQHVAPSADRPGT
jgi:hypothetical protein